MPEYGTRRVVLDLSGLKPDTVGNDRYSIEVPIVDLVDYDYELRNLVKTVAPQWDDADLDFLASKIHLAIEGVQLTRLLSSRIRRT